MVLYLFDSSGYFTGVCEGLDAHENGTPIAPPDTSDGQRAKFENGAWTIEEANALPLLTPMQFYLAFATSERMMLKDLATTGLPANSAFNQTATAIPADPIIEEFWATYQMAVQSNAHVDPNLASIQEGLAYLASPTAPTPAVITAARVPQILAGIAQ